ncbi:S-layer homology domain-containing protein [Candidatus Saganbacteria bacterium]|nr:S-layer homology domain-containing protein [Candidatus Saganbacteria bacterium]
MRQSISLLILFILCNLSFADEFKFKDIPDKHWAESAVYKLVKEGVTSGYPDNTFRGLKYMTREQLAVFLSNLVKNKENYLGLEKILEELKAETADLKYETENPQKPKIKGAYDQEILWPSIINGGLKLSIFEKLGRSGDVSVNFDTMDSGFGAAPKSLTLDLFDIDSHFRSGERTYHVFFGPGPIVHRDLVTPFDDLAVFNRIKKGVGVQATYKNLDIQVEYIAHSVKLSGAVSADQIVATISGVTKPLPLFGKTLVSLSPSYFSNNEAADWRGDVYLFATPTPFVSLDLLLGIGNFRSRAGLMLRSGINIKKENMEVTLSASKVGSDFRQPIEKFNLIYLNNFNKMILDATYNLDISFSHKITDKFGFYAKENMALNGAFKYGKEYPGTTWSSELGIIYKLNQTALSSFYKSLAAPSGISSINQTLATTVPELSSFVGVKASISL